MCLDFLGSVIGEDIIEEEEEDYDQFSLTESSTVVEKFIRVIESSSNSKFENTTATTKSSNDSEIAASNTNREDIRRKLAFNKPEPASFEAKAKSNKKNDLEGGFHRTFQFLLFASVFFLFCNLGHKCRRFSKVYRNIKSSPKSLNPFLFLLFSLKFEYLLHILGLLQYFRN